MQTPNLPHSTSKPIPLKTNLRFRAAPGSVFIRGVNVVYHLRWAIAGHLFHHPAKVAKIADFSPFRGEKYQVFEVLFNFLDFIFVNSL
jgi:hypothetical protein